MDSVINLKRIRSGSVTDALIRATEHAGEMKSVIIIYEAKDGSESPGGFFSNDDMTLERLNFLLDKTKAWIFGP